MKKKVLSLVLSLVMAATSFAGMTPPMTVSAEETIVEPAAKYSTGAETAINNGMGTLVESDVNVVNQFKNLEDFTMNAKFKVTGTSGVQSLFFVGDSTKNPNYVSVWVSGSGNNNIGVESYNAAGDKVIDQNSKTSSVVFDDQEEHTFTYRHDKDGNITFYIDGNVAWSGSANNLGFTEGLFAEGATMYMGMGNGNRPNGGNNYPFTGTLKDVEIYTSAISDEQVAAYHAKPEDYENLVYKVENFVEKTALTDSADLAVLKALNSGVVSICYRVDSADAGKTTLFALTDADGQQYFEVYVNPAENKVGAVTSGLVVPAGGKATDYNEDWVLNSTHGVDIQDTNWHVLTVRKGIPGNDGKSEYNFFVDGVRLDGKYTKIGYMHSVTDADAISIGSLKTGSADSNSMKGAIDSVRVYSGTLTNEQIAALAENLVFEAEKVDDMTGATKTETEALYYGGYDGSTAYRIPSLMTTQEGTVLAFIDQRNSGAGDNGNIDLMVRRREAGETSFDEGINIVDLVDNNNQTPCAFMIDACTLQDRETGRIFLIADMFPESSGLMNTGILSPGHGYKEINGTMYQKVFQNGTEFGTIRENGVVYDTNGEKTEYTVVTECEAPYNELGNLYKNGEYVGNIYIFSGAKKGDLHILRTQYLWMTYSDDDGKTWSLPKDISPQVKEDWMLFCGDGPGVGLQLEDGTLTFPVYTTTYNNWGNTQSSAMIYSTDGGETWTLGESPVKLNGPDRNDEAGVAHIYTESQAIQLQNGDVKLFMRNYGNKVSMATSTDGGKTWDKVETLPIYDAYCQLSVINYVKDGVEYVVVSNPGASGRNVGTITLGTVQEDGSINWEYSKVIEPGRYQYSCLTKLGLDSEGDMQFGVLYETDVAVNGGTDIQIFYTEFDEQWIKNGKVDAVQKNPVIVSKEIERKNDKVTIKLTFDQTVMAAGEVGLKLSLAGNTGLAVYKDGSGSNTLTFEGTIPSGTGVLKVTGIDTEKGYLENKINQEPVNVEFDLIALNELQFVDAKATSQHSTSTAENTDGAAINAIDGNPNTYWHSTWGNASITLPQSITMELAETKTIYKFVYTPRQNSQSGRVKDYELAVSVDGEKFETVATGTFTGGAADETVEFAPVEAKYVKLTALTSTVAGSCNMAEAKVYEYADGVYEVSDLSVLKAEIAKAEAILASENNYSEATLEILQEVVAQVAQSGKEGISVDAESKLVDMLKKETGKLVDTTRGLTAIEEAEALLASENEYTEASKEQFAAAIATAKENLKVAETTVDVTSVIMKLNYEASLLTEKDTENPGENPDQILTMPVKYSTGTETTVNGGAGAIVEEGAEILDAFKNLEDFTMNAKFKVTGDGGVQTLFFAGDSTKNPNYVSVWVSGSGNNNIGVESYNVTGVKVINQNSKTSSVTFDDQEEHTFTYRHDKDGDITFYIDGKVAWSGSANNLGFTEGLFAEGATMYMGMGNGNRPNGGNNYPLTGTLKDVEIYTSAISEEEIMAYHNGPEEFENLVFKKENIVNPVTLTDEAVNTIKDLENGVVSVCYRVEDTNAEKTTLFALTDADGESYFEFYVNPKSNAMGAAYKTEGGNVVDLPLNNTHGVDIADDDWHVVTLRKAASGNQPIELFVDGQKIDHYTKTGFFNTITDADTISIGCLTTGSDNTNELNGAIDSVRVYSGTLTDEQIEDLAEHLVFEADKVDDMTGATKTEPESLYYSGYDGSKAYRIPSLLKTQEGTMLAIIDQRNSGSADNGNIDLMVRRREADSDTFDEGINVIDLIDTNNGTPCAFMIDACTLQDRETGRIFVVVDMFPESSGMMNSGLLLPGSGYKEIDGKDYQMVFKNGEEFGTIREGGMVYDVNGEKTEYTVITECEAPYKELGNIYKNGEYVGNMYLFSGDNAGELHIMRAHYLWMTYSDDDGKTWSLPVDLTPQVKEDWMLFIGDGPGVGLQLKDGTLAIPVYTTTQQNWGGTQSSALIYSTDGGKTWTLGV